MASTCSFLQLHLSQNPNFPPLSSSSSSSSSSRSINLSNPSRRSLSFCSEKSNLFGGNVDLNDSSINSIVNPSSLRFGNVLRSTSGFNAQVFVDEDEPEEVLLRRFKREVSKAGIIQEFRRRKHFENKQEEKKRKLREAGKRNRRRKYGPRPYPGSEEDTEGATKEKDDDDDDNWDMPAEGLPY